MHVLHRARLVWAPRGTVDSLCRSNHHEGASAPMLPRVGVVDNVFWASGCRGVYDPRGHRPFFKLRVKVPYITRGLPVPFYASTIYLFFN